LASGAAALGAVLLAACASSASSESGPGQQSSGGAYSAPAKDVAATLTLSNWGDPGDKAVYDAAIARFNQSYPNVKVVDNFTPITTWTEYVNKLVAAQAAGQAPDVINIALEGLRLGVSKEMFGSINHYLESDPAGAALAADIDPTLMKSLAVDGEQYLMPSTWNQMLIYYNTKMFKDAGIARPADNWTWDDFNTIAKKLTTGTGSSKVYGFGLPNFNFGLTPWLYSNGTSQLNSDWTASNLTDAKVAASYQYAADLVKNGQAPAPKGADPYQLFPAGKVAMTGAGHWVVGGFLKAGFKDWDILPWPTGTTQGTVFGSSGFGISPSSQSKDLAWELIKVLDSQETQMAWVKIGAGNPASKTAAQSPEFLAFPAHADLYYGALAYATPVAAPTVFNVLDPSVSRAFDEILAGQDASGALSTADKEVNDAFAGQ